MSKFDVIYSASAPFAAYASGIPYCVFSVGGDLQFDCGRADDLGKSMSLAFNAARFLLASNPHTLGHARRLGLRNAVYLPYPMDSNRYHPGPGRVRSEWVARYGEGVYVLCSTRLDARVKGYGSEFLNALITASEREPRLRFLFLAWGENADSFRKLVQEAAMDQRIFLLPPVGKRRLIDYYRSCDVVLDQLVFGYYGATALEAAAVGKPVVMHLRLEQYRSLYRDDVMPAVNAQSLDELSQALVTLAANSARRGQLGQEMRDWLVRTHGEERTGPLMLALLRLAADRIALPQGLDNPLLDPITDEEAHYHRACRRPAQ
jgi:glycosyltransferase involved in cell wall biosynthesis